jgi:dimethylsulfone monooxygenase
VDAWAAGIAKESRSLKNEATHFSRLQIAAGGNPMVGSAADIADQITALNELGIDGILLSWFDFDDGVKRFAEEVMPVLEKRGLREPFGGAHV